MNNSMEKTLAKFGYPDTLIEETDFWYILLRPGQVTLGALILIEKSGKKQFSELSSESINDMGITIKRIEKVLSDLFNYEKINYLMLMMLDPEVHFHIIPRYSTEQRFKLIKFKDAGWPGLPDLTLPNKISRDVFKSLFSILKSAFN